MSAVRPTHIAAVIPGKQDNFDTLLADFARQLIDSGRQVRGLIQQTRHFETRCEVSLLSLSDGREFPITQDLGAFSTACSLDPAALTEAGALYRQIGNTSPVDLVIFNRFGKLELEGQGFAAEMLDLMSRDIPSLTIVQDKYLDGWRNFTGGLSVELDAQPAALEAWFLAIAPEDNGQES